MGTRLGSIVSQPSSLLGFVLCSILHPQAIVGVSREHFLNQLITQKSHFQLWMVMKAPFSETDNSESLACIAVY